MSVKAAGIPRYRPFFLGAGLWALIAMALWIRAVQGYVTIPTALDPAAWHAHER